MTTIDGHCAGEELAHAWMDHVRGADVDSLARMYERDAVISAFHDVLAGRDEIQQRLAPLARHLRRMHIDKAKDIRSDGGSLAFETEVSGPLGRVRLRHLLEVANGRIRSHHVDLLFWDKAPASPTAAV